MKIVRRHIAGIGPLGFTLIEALFSFGIIGVLVIGLYSALTSGFSGVQDEREDARATQILIEKMDQLRVVSWDDIVEDKIPGKFLEHFDPTRAPGTYEKDDPLVYEGKVKVKKGPNDVSYEDYLKTITIELKWTSFAGRERKRELTTYYARYGLQNYVY